jgi:ankyrin repeat protein
MATVLLAKGAAINATNAKGETPLQLAIALGRKDIIRLHKKSGAK